MTSERVRDLIERRGCELLYLPGYSPDYNPIEEAFSKIKQILRGAAARTRGALVEAIGRALSAVSSQDARSFFGHAGYRSKGQLLWNALLDNTEGRGTTLRPFFMPLFTQGPRRGILRSSR